MTVRRLLAADALDGSGSGAAPGEAASDERPLEALALHVSAFRLAGERITDLLDPGAPRTAAAGASHLQNSANEAAILLQIHHVGCISGRLQSRCE